VSYAKPVLMTFLFCLDREMKLSLISRIIKTSNIWAVSPPKLFTKIESYTFDRLCVGSVEGGKGKKISQGCVLFKGQWREMGFFSI
jgi:hypothetical protein